MKTLIVGCGYLGTTLGKALLARGGEVWALRRDLDALMALERAGFYLFRADLTDPRSLDNLPQADAVVVCQAPRRGETYKATYFDGTKNLVAALAPRKPDKLLLVSSTSVYSTAGGEWVDEATQPLAHPHASKEDNDNAHFLLGAEKAVLSSGIPSMVLRLGGLYGPGRHRLRPLKEGKMSPSFSDSVYVNRIRVEDAVAGILLLLEKGKPGEIYLGVDDAPSTQNEFYSWVYDKLALPRPAVAGPDAPHGSNKRCSNAKMKALGFRPSFPSFREGYEPLFREV
jgi:nucleoside-diphosphate-sugar epimerase